MQQLYWLLTTVTNDIKTSTMKGTHTVFGLRALKQTMAGTGKKDLLNQYEST